MIIYNKKIQFISLPELISEIRYDADIGYLLRDVLTDMLDKVPYQVEVGGHAITISNTTITRYQLVFLPNGMVMQNRIRTMLLPNTLYICSSNINEFIMNQLPSDNDTLFLPKLVEGV